MDPLTFLPEWVAYKGTTVHTLTSKSGRKEKTWTFEQDQGLHVCSYRVREVSNIGKINHWKLDAAYYPGTTLDLSVKPEYIDVGFGMAEIPHHGRASLHVEIDWYLIQVPVNRDFKWVVKDLTRILELGERYLNRSESGLVRSAFRGGLWPHDVRCFDQPHSVHRDRRSYPADIPFEFGARQPTGATLDATVRLFIPMGFAQGHPCKFAQPVYAENVNDFPVQIELSNRSRYVVPAKTTDRKLLVGYTHEPPKCETQNLQIISRSS